jgi:hypothetical protein
MNPTKKVPHKKYEKYFVALTYLLYQFRNIIYILCTFYIQYEHIKKTSDYTAT